VFGFDVNATPFGVGERFRFAERFVDSPRSGRGLFVLYPEGIMSISRWLSAAITSGSELDLRLMGATLSGSKNRFASRWGAFAPVNWH